MKKPFVVVISSSQSDPSRSKTLTQFAHVELDHKGVLTEFIDLSAHDIQIYPRSANDPVLQILVEKFEQADAFVIGTPIYNWHSASSISNFLHYALDPENGRRYRPFLLLAGAGSSRSHLACDDLARTITSEIHGVQIGPPIVGAGHEVEKETGHIEAALQQRIAKAISILVKHAEIAHSLSFEAATL